MGGGVSAEEEEAAAEGGEGSSRRWRRQWRVAAKNFGSLTISKRRNWVEDLAKISLPYALGIYTRGRFVRAARE